MAFPCCRYASHPRAGNLQYGPDNVNLQYSIQRQTFDPRDAANPDLLTKFVVRNTKVWLGGASISTYGDRFMVSGPGKCWRSGHETGRAHTQFDEPARLLTFRPGGGMEPNEGSDAG